MPTEVLINNTIQYKCKTCKQFYKPKRSDTSDYCSQCTVARRAGYMSGYMKAKYQYEQKLLKHLKHESCWCES